MMNKKRILISILTGAVLGIFCIVGVGTRIGFESSIFLIAMWYNRVVMGLMIGLAGDIHLVKSNKNFIIRGFLFGLVVSSAIFLTSEFRDVPSFFAGIVYGVIIDFVATRFN